MIFGNESLVHIDGAEFLRAARLGDLDAIAEEMGMGLDARQTMAIEELHNRLKEEMYKEVKGKIPCES